MSGYQDACARVASTGCQGFTGPYDRYICDRPCRRPYSIETWSFGPSESEIEGDRS